MFIRGSRFYFLQCKAIFMQNKTSNEPCKTPSNVFPQLQSVVLIELTLHIIYISRSNMGNAHFFMSVKPLDLHVK